jgi:ceramide glucosyltransferase
VACLYQLGTYFLVIRFRRFEVDPPVAERPTYPVSQLKPLHGVQPRSESNLLSFLEQDYLGPSEMVCCLREGDFQIEEIARRLNPGGVVVGTPREECPNLKVANLLQGYPRCRYPFVLLSDADMWAPRGHLDKVMEHFEDERVGLVTALYCAQRVHRPAMALEALSGVDFAASVLVARVVEGLSFGLGANLACRREALEEIGGFEPLGQYLADDYQLGQRMHRAGWKIKLAGSILEDTLPDLSFRDYLSHQLRWLRTYRISRPGGHAAFIVTQGLIWTLALGVVYGWSWLSVLAFTGWWEVRRRCAEANWRNLGGHSVSRWIAWLGPKDALYLGLWVASWVGDTVRWGSRKLQLLPGGRVR